MWLETRGVPWMWAPIDCKRIRDCLKFRAGGDPEVLLERARTLLVKPPTLWLAQNASPAVLYSQWHALGTSVSKMTREEMNLSTLAAAARVL